MPLITHHPAPAFCEWVRKGAAPRIPAPLECVLWRWCSRAVLQKTVGSGVTAVHGSASVASCFSPWPQQLRISASSRAFKLRCCPLAGPAAPSALLLSETSHARFSPPLLCWSSVLNFSPLTGCISQRLRVDMASLDGTSKMRLSLHLCPVSTLSSPSHWSSRSHVSSLLLHAYLLPKWRTELSIQLGHSSCTILEQAN